MKPDSTVQPELTAALRSPAQAGSSPQPEPVTHADASAPSPQRVLIVDDEPHITALVRLKLMKAGFEVLCAASAEQAWELARAHRPALVITDLDMPGLGGAQLCALLHQDPQTAATPVIVLSGRPGDGARTATPNIRLVLTKPFSPRDLAREVCNLLSPAPLGVPRGVE